MRTLNYVTAVFSLLLALGALFRLPMPVSLAVAVIFVLIAAYAATAKVKSPKGQFVVQLKGFKGLCKN